MNSEMRSIIYSLNQKLCHVTIVQEFDLVLASVLWTRQVSLFIISSDTCYNEREYRLFAHNAILA